MLLEKLNFRNNPVHKKKIVILVFSVLVLASIWLIRKQIQKSRKHDIQFNLAEQSSPDKISISEGGNVCELIKTEERWMVNTSTEAKTPLINYMLSKLKLLKMDYPPSRAEMEYLKDTLSKYGRTIELSQNGKTIYRLYFLEYRGRNIALNRKQEPYYVTIPGNKLMSLQKLIPVQPEDWKKNILIDIPKENIVSLSLTYPNNQGKSFTIEQNGSSSYKLLDEHHEIISNTESIEIQDYLMFYKGIAYLLYDKTSHSIFKAPYFQLCITMKDSTKITCEGYELNIRNSQKTDENYCGIITNREDTVIVKYTDIDPLLVEKDYFLKK